MHNVRVYRFRTQGEQEPGRKNNDATDVVRASLFGFCDRSSLIRGNPLPAYFPYLAVVSCPVLRNGRGTNRDDFSKLLSLVNAQFTSIPAAFFFQRKDCGSEHLALLFLIHVWVGLGYDS